MKQAEEQPIAVDRASAVDAGRSLTILQERIVLNSKMYFIYVRYWSSGQYWTNLGT